MTYKIKKTWKDLIEKDPNHARLTRRDFMARGMATGVMAMALPRTALAGSTCATPTRASGAIAQLYAQGGPTMGARFISQAQASAMNATMAANYGISGTNLTQLGTNLVIDSASPFGFTLLQGPPGYSGGPSQWQANVLSKVSGGGHLGPFNQDDGAGADTGLLGAVSPFKASQMGKDLRIGVQNQMAAWANGLPNASIGSATPSSLASTFSMTPPAPGLTNATALSRTSDAINALAQAMDPVFKTSLRKGGQQLLAAASCAFYGNSAMADPSYGATLFTPSNISTLTSYLTVGSLTSEEQAQLAAFYQSAVGVAGGVVIELVGRDYHGADPQQVIAPADIEEARALVMFLAACDAAKAPGALIYLANGQAIAKGTQQVTATINGAQATLQAPVATGDAGGAYNAGLIVFYDPKGSPPAATFTGTLNSAADGSVTMSSTVGTSANAVAGLYLSALKWVNGGNVPQSAISAMQAAGVAAQPTSVEVF